MLSKIIKELEKLWIKFRPQRRLWVTVKYGGVIIEDNRTFKEKFRDFVDGLFDEFRYNELKRTITKQTWHTYFDESTGQWIDSSSKIRDMERAGYTYTTFTEMEKHCAKIRKEKKEQQRKHIRKGLEQKMQQLNQGKSFIPKLERARIELK
jgi:hypothetical protein